MTNPFSDIFGDRPTPEPSRHGDLIPVFTEIVEALNDIATAIAVNAEQASDRRALDDMANKEYERVCVERDNWKEDARVRAQNTDHWRMEAERLQGAMHRLASAAEAAAENPFTDARRVALLDLAAQLRAAKGGV